MEQQAISKIVSKHANDVLTACTLRKAIAEVLDIEKTNIVNLIDNMMLECDQEDNGKDTLLSLKYRLKDL